MKNKKSFFPGATLIASFFISAIVFIFIVGMYDFSIVEIYEPAHAIMNDSLTNMNLNNSAVTAFRENNTTTHARDLPFNLLFIFLTMFAVIYSIVNVARTKKLEPFELVFQSIGGIIFFIYLMQISIFKAITYFKLEIVDYLFVDLIVNYVPAYLILYTNAYKFILIWACVLLLVNWYFGKESKEGGFNT